jgi:hypothetical protein
MHGESLVLFSIPLNSHSPMEDSYCEMSSSLCVIEIILQDDKFRSESPFGSDVIFDDQCYSKPAGSK